jgi:uncharacterized protein (TIGR03437 family)
LLNELKCAQLKQIVLAITIAYSQSLPIAAAAPVPHVLTLENAASRLTGPISPGELVTVTGSAVGPDSPADGGVFKINSVGGIDSILQGVRVLFDNIPGTPIYVSATQINLVVPWEIGGRLSTSVIVEYNGVQSSPVVILVDDVTPAVFTVDGSGRGLAAAVNQDGHINGPFTKFGPAFFPAPAGSVVAIFLTGAGQTTPPEVTGSVNPINRLLPITSQVTATIGGKPADVEFLGAAPGIVNGVFQLNLRVPGGWVESGVVPLQISINGVPIQGGSGIAVQ